MSTLLYQENTTIGYEKFEQAGFLPNMLLTLNRVWINQQVVFLSDILNASGTSLDNKYLERCLTKD